MRKLLKQAALAAILFLIWTRFAPFAAAQTVALDPALLAKASSGDAAAEVQAGDSYASSNGMARNAKQLAADYRLAAEWYRNAAEQNFIPGELKLAALYRDGRGVDRDAVQAAVWYRKAAEQGDVSAQATLGLLYSIGQGVAQNYIEAYYWFDVAASVKGPNQQKYAANRQMMGEHLTTGDVEEVEERVAGWIAAHPH